MRWRLRSLLSMLHHDVRDGKREREGFLEKRYASEKLKSREGKGKEKKI
jgi:hypothetical protein